VSRSSRCHTNVTKYTHSWVVRFRLKAILLLANIRRWVPFGLHAVEEVLDSVGRCRLSAWIFVVVDLRRSLFHRCSRRQQCALHCTEFRLALDLTRCGCWLAHFQLSRLMCAAAFANAEPMNRIPCRRRLQHSAAANCRKTVNRQATSIDTCLRQYCVLVGTSNCPPDQSLDLNVSPSNQQYTRYRWSSDRPRMKAAAVTKAGRQNGNAECCSLTFVITFWCDQLYRLLCYPRLVTTVYGGGDQKRD